MGSPNPNNIKFNNNITISGSGDGYRLNNSIIDELSIYNGKLLPQEIDERYAQQFNPRNQSYPTINDSISNFGMVAHFDFDGEVKNTLNNKVYNPNSAGGTNPEFVSGVKGNALKSKYNQYLIPLDDLNIDSNTKNVSTAFWIQLKDDNIGDNWLIPLGFNSYDIGIFRSNGSIGFNTTNGDLFRVDKNSVNLKDDNWHYVVAV